MGADQVIRMAKPEHLWPDLIDRIHCVSEADKTLPDVGHHFGVPQESILWPKNYCMYIKPVDAIIKWHNIKYHSLHCGIYRGSAER